MESFFTRFLNPLVLIAVLLVQTIALATQVRRNADISAPDGKQIRLLRLWADAAVTPFERLAYVTSTGIYGAWVNYLDLRNARRVNKDLESEIARLRLEQAGFAEDALEGRRLQTLLAFKQQYVASTVAAQVIGVSGSDQSRMLTLDKGAADGLKPDQPVITPDGIVGKLRDVFPHSAQLLLINDPTSGAGVVLASTRIRAIVKGSVTGRVQIGNLTADARIKPGEIVLTSGGDQVYPRGLPVGVIESITPDFDHQPYTLINVKSAANLFQLEEVLVITGTQPGISSQAERDLAAGVATAGEIKQIAAQKKLEEETAQKAADTLAQRLPGIHDPDAAADPTLDPNTPADLHGPAPVDTMPAPAPAENAPGLVPKPAPSLHLDRYSAGTAPPASALTPGGGGHDTSPAARTANPARSTSTSAPATAASANAKAATGTPGSKPATTAASPAGSPKSTGTPKLPSALKSSPAAKPPRTAQPPSTVLSAPVNLGAPAAKPTPSRPAAPKTPPIAPSAPPASPQRRP